MLKQRIITAVILFLVLILSIITSLKAFEAVMGIAFALVFYEWLLLLKFKKATVYVFTVAFGAMAFLMIFTEVRLPYAALLGLHLIVGCLWAALIAVIFNARHKGFLLKLSQHRALAFLFAPVAWFAFLWLADKGGWPLVVSAFAIVWIADIFAYAFGLTFGKNRLAPAISPKKSWEGVYGAYGCVFVAAIVAANFLATDVCATSLILNKAGIFSGCVILFLLVTISIVGDLFESGLKRQVGVKDSSRLLPGHGGFYDRMDAAIAVLPCVVLFLLIL